MGFKKQVQDRVLFRNLIIIFFSLVIIYVVIHLNSISREFKGRQVLLTADQTATLKSIESSFDTIQDSLQNSLSTPLYRLKLDTLYLEERKLIESFLSTIDLTDSIKVSEIDLFYRNLTNRPFNKESYFFLLSPLLFLEVILWGLMGVICNSLYHISEYARQGTYKDEEEIVYYAKILYAPIICLVIYFGLDYLGSDLGTLPTPANTILLSFLLGFFSGRSIGLLDRLKNVILPGENQSFETTRVNEKNDDSFKSQTHKKQKEIVDSFIEKNSESLMKKYPEIQSISSKLKISGGQTLNYYCVHFSLLEKNIDPYLTTNIPKSYPFVYEENEYNIETDIDEVGEVGLSSRFIGKNVSPKQLGLSCSRIGSSETGTIGLKVKKKKPFDNRRYLLSCYHVLCAPELQENTFQFDNTKAVNTEVISPSVDDESSSKENVVGNVVEGKINKYIDAAIAELKNPNQLKNELYDNNGIPNGTRKITEQDINKLRLKLAGRTSGRNSGMVKDNSVNILKVDGHIFHELIECEKMSHKGDSGAPVLTYSNEVVGILMADGHSSSYIVPIQAILTRFKIKLSS